MFGNNVEFAAQGHVRSAGEVSGAGRAECPKEPFGLHTGVMCGPLPCRSWSVPSARVEGPEWPLDSTHDNVCPTSTC